MCAVRRHRAGASFRQRRLGSQLARAARPPFRAERAQVELPGAAPCRPCQAYQFRSRQPEYDLCIGRSRRACCAALTAVRVWDEFPGPLRRRAPLDGASGRHELLYMPSPAAASTPGRRRGAHWEQWTQEEKTRSAATPMASSSAPSDAKLLFMTAAHDAPGTWRNTHFAGARISRSKDGGRSWEILKKRSPRPPASEHRSVLSGRSGIFHRDLRRDHRRRNPLQPGPRRQLESRRQRIGADLQGRTLPRAGAGGIIYAFN